MKIQNLGMVSGPAITLLTDEALDKRGRMDQMREDLPTKGEHHDGKKAGDSTSDLVAFHSRNHKVCKASGEEKKDPDEEEYRDTSRVLFAGLVCISVEAHGKIP